MKFSKFQGSSIGPVQLAHMVFSDDGSSLPRLATTWLDVLLIVHTKDYAFPTSTLQFHTHTDRNAHMQRHTDRQTNTCTHKITHKHTHTQTYTHTHTHTDVYTQHTNLSRHCHIAKILHRWVGGELVKRCHWADTDTIQCRAQDEEQPVHPQPPYLPHCNMIMEDNSCISCPTRTIAISIWMNSYVQISTLVVANMVFFLVSTPDPNQPQRGSLPVSHAGREGLVKLLHIN